MTEPIAMSYLSCSDARSIVPAASGTHRLAWRWGVALAAVAILHGSAAVWFERVHDAFAPQAVKPPVQVALLTPQPIARERLRPASRHPAPARSEPAGSRSPGLAPVLHALTSARQAAGAADETAGARAGRGSSASATAPGTAPTAAAVP